MQKAEDRPVQIKVLDNGTRIMVHNFAGSEVVGLSMLFGIDSCTTDDKDKKMARVVAEMVSAFINDRENRKFNRHLDNIGASLNAGFTGDALLLTAKTQKQNLPELAALLRDMIKFPEYSERFFKKSKEKLLQRIEDDEQSNINVINRKIMQVLFPGMDILGTQLTAEDLEKISFKDIQTFYRNWAVGANLHISAVGNFSPEKTVDILAEAFRDIPAGKQSARSQCPEWVAKPLEKTMVEKLTLPGSSENASIAVAFRMKPFLLINKKEELRTNFGANLVISHVLFSSSNAILAQELKKIDAYRGLIGNYRTNQTHAILVFMAEVPREKVDQAKAVIEKVVAGIPQLNFSKDNITAAGKNLRSLFNRMLEKSDVQASVLAGFLYNGLKDDFLEEMLGIYSSVTIDDVKKSASENFNTYLMLIGEPGK
jgi:predicted Zn-dependent peptidase